MKEWRPISCRSLCISERKALYKVNRILSYKINGKNIKNSVGICFPLFLQRICVLHIYIVEYN